MKDYKKAYDAIQEVKKLINGLTFEDAGKKLAGYNGDNLTIDYDYGNITGTIWNDKGMAKIWEESSYDIIDDDWEHTETPIEYNITELEIQLKAGIK